VGLGSKNQFLPPSTPRPQSVARSIAHFGATGGTISRVNYLKIALSLDCRSSGKNEHRSAVSAVSAVKIKALPTEDREDPKRKNCELPCRRAVAVMHRQYPLIQRNQRKYANDVYCRFSIGHVSPSQRSVRPASWHSLQMP
jgi:hypothetical protein